GLTKAIKRDGGRLYTGIHATAMTGGSPARVETKSGHVITAGALVVATNTPVNDLLSIHARQAAYRTYVIAAVAPRKLVPHALLWDTLDPYHYVRVAPFRNGYDLLIVGGEDHKTGQADDEKERYDRLTTWARRRFP